MTTTIAAKLNLKLWCIDFVGVYLNSLTKEDIYMKQLEGFVELGYEDHVCKLVHMIYGTMQGGHDWYEALTKTFKDLGYTTSHADRECHGFLNPYMSQVHSNESKIIIFGPKLNEI